MSDSDRKGTRLLAINLRLAELKQEAHETQLHVRQLEAELDDARLAGLMGEETKSLSEIGPELEKSRARLEHQNQLIETVKKNQWNARVQYAVSRIKERQAEREQAEADASLEDADRADADTA